MLDDLKTENSEEILIEEQQIDPVLLTSAVKAGVVAGLRHSKTNPKMSPFIAMTRSGVEVIDFFQTLKALEASTAFLQETVKMGGKVLILGTEPAVKGLVEEFAKRNQLSYVVERWLGGTFTNFKTIYSRLQYYLKLKTDKEAGRLGKYTKKERNEFDKQIARLSVFFSGLETLKDLPNVLLVVNPTRHEMAVREAIRVRIPVVAIINTDGDPEQVTYPIPANDRSRSSVTWVLGKLEEAVLNGAKERAELLTRAVEAKKASADSVPQQVTK